ncbi:MAG: hypothetical protein J6386_18845 [Candidatus Synoicihabitans palmerolidicus]|nr:hypothetical protein [Candidatus Synoicihabitans palmerolidicus]
MKHDDLALFKKVLIGSLYDESAWTFVSNELPDPKVSWLIQLKQRALAKFWQILARRGLYLLRPLPYDEDLRVNGTDWPLIGYSMIGAKRLDQLQIAVETVLDENVPGDFIETGVWRGGSCMLIKQLLNLANVSDRSVWLADSFSGLPPPKDQFDGKDISDIAFLAVSEAQVRQNFARFDLLDDQVKFLKGWFFDTLPDAPIDQIAVLRLGWGSLSFHHGCPQRPVSSRGTERLCDR